MPKKKIRLGDEIEDVTAKLRGIVIGRIEYLDGAVAWLIQPESTEQRILIGRVEVQDGYARKVGNGVYPKPKPPVGFHVREESD